MIIRITNKNIRHSAGRAIDTRVILPIACIPVSRSCSGCNNVLFVGRVSKTEGSSRDDWDYVLFAVGKQDRT